MEKLQIKFKKFFERKDTSGLSIFGRGHHFDWKVLLSLFFLIILGILFYNINIFLGVRSGDLFQVPESSIAPTALINRNGLDTVIKIFDAKAEKLKAIQTGKPVLVDPSH